MAKYALIILFFLLSLTIAFLFFFLYFLLAIWFKLSLGIGVGIAVISLIRVMIIKIKINRIRAHTLSLKETRKPPSVSIAEENLLHSIATIPCVTDHSRHENNKVDPVKIIEQNEQSENDENLEFEISDDDPNYSTVRPLESTTHINKLPSFVPLHKKVERKQISGDLCASSIAKKRFTNAAEKNYEEIDLTPCVEETPLNISVQQREDAQIQKTWKDSHVYSVVNKKKSTKTSVNEDSHDNYLYAVVDKKKPKTPPRSSELEALQLNNHGNDSELNDDNYLPPRSSDCKELETYQLNNHGNDSEVNPRCSVADKKTKSINEDQDCVILKARH